MNELEKLDNVHALLINLLGWTYEDFVNLLDNMENLKVDIESLILLMHNEKIVYSNLKSFYQRINY